MKYVVGLFFAGLMLPIFTGGNPVSFGSGDGDRRFYTSDRSFYSSPWYAGKHRKMIRYGCTRAPHYSPDRDCKDRRGFHHGIDLAMPCGTKLYAGRPGWVVANDTLGRAYGSNPVLIRNYDLNRDFVIGHTRRVYVKPGDRVEAGDLIARASDAGAPDGCHLHFEVRRARGSVNSAELPLRYLGLSKR